MAMMELPVRRGVVRLPLRLPSRFFVLGASPMMQARFAAQRAEDRIDMKVTALLVGNQDKLGVETGVSLDNLSQASAFIATRIDHPLPSRYAQAGPGRTRRA